MSKTQDGKRASGSSADDLLDEKGSASRAGVKSAKRKDAKAGRESIFVRAIRFIRETVGELRKVIWPTRKDLITYTIVTVIFVTILVSFVWSLDYGLAKIIITLFGDPDTQNPGVSGG